MWPVVLTLLIFARDTAYLLLGILFGQLCLLYIQILRCRCQVGELVLLQLLRPGLFKQTAANVCLVFEEPYPEFFQLEDRARLVDLGPLNAERGKYVKRLHIVHESADMGYAAKHASSAHYKCFFSDAVAFLELNPMEYNWYQANTDYSNGFFDILAAPESIRRWTSKIDWTFVKKKAEKAKDDPKRQEHNDGFGYTSGMCNAHDIAKNKAGASDPHLRDEISLPQV